ncbi:hypothetical protein [Bacillus dakarensis]|uniref:hypothetical protein n=1 Tax=Robertmurraya dakarensis TaxID=1926278 RepID=UPI000980B165|nr:hypothetical protein [Bacillus dakarensis]
MIEVGTKYQISKGIKGFYNSAETLTVVRNYGMTIQFTLGDGKGQGAMPIQHLQYLLKRADLTQVKSKRMLLNSEEMEEQAN